MVYEFKQDQKTSLKQFLRVTQARKLDVNSVLKKALCEDTKQLNTPEVTRQSGISFKIPPKPT